MAQQNRQQSIIYHVTMPQAKQHVPTGTVHRPDDVGSLCPWRVLPSACVMVQEVLLNVAVHPALHSWPSNNRDVSPRLGKVNDCVASFGRFGIGRFLTCVEYIWSWLAILTATGIGVGCRFLKGVQVET